MALVSDRPGHPEAFDDGRRILHFLHRNLGVHPDVAEVLVVLFREFRKRGAFAARTELEVDGLRFARFEPVEALVDVASEPAPPELAVVDDVDARRDLLAD